MSKAKLFRAIVHTVRRAYSFHRMRELARERDEREWQSLEETLQERWVDPSDLGDNEVVRRIETERRSRSGNSGGSRDDNSAPNENDGNSNGGSSNGSTSNGNTSGGNEWDHIR